MEDSNIDLKEVGLRIRDKRKSLGLSRERLAKIVDLSPHYLGQIERGERNMSTRSLVNISNSLNISIDYILKGSNFYMEDYLMREIIDSNYIDTLDVEIKDILSLLYGLSKDNLTVIQDLIKVVLPSIKK